MSCFIMDIKSIQKIVSYASHYNYRYENFSVKGNEALVGQALVDCNFLSVNFRYKEKQEPITYKHNEHFSSNALQFIALCKCLRYQSFDYPDYNDKPLLLFICNAVNNIPGYSD